MRELSPEQITEISQLSRQGYHLLKEGSKARAAENFKRILEMEPENQYALVGLGDVYRKDRRFSEARDYYMRCLEFQPENSYALFGLADCYKALGKSGMAIGIWEEYLKHDKQNITVLTRLADAYRKMKKLPESREIYHRVLEMDENNSYALIGLGHLHYDFKEYEEALIHLKKMESLIGERIDIRVLTTIGNCYRKLKQFENGVPYFKRALEIQGENFYALYGLADCYRGLNRPEDSLVSWNQILKRDAENKVILTRAGDACRILEDFERASEYYNQALSIEYDLYAELGLALISRRQGNFNRAIRLLEHLIQKEPDNPRFYLEAAECACKIQDVPRARRFLEDFHSRGLQNQKISEYYRTLEEL